MRPTSSTFPISIFAAALSMFTMLTISAFADVVTLKSGERVEGKIVQDNDKTVTITVQVTPSISDDRVIQKAEVASVFKASPDEVAYQALLNLKPGQNSLSSAQYTQVLNELDAFLVRYRASPHVKEIKQTMNSFIAEQKRVDAGEIKMNGEWLNREQVRIQRVQVGGSFAFEAMKSQSAGGDFVGALNSFVSIEKTYTGARTYPEALELAKQILSKFGPMVETAMANEKVSKANLEKGWKEAGPKDRADMMESYKRTQAQDEAASTYAEHAGQWPPYAKDCEKCLKTLQTKIATEYQRLSILPVSSYKSSVELSDQAAHQAAAGQDIEAKAALKDALTLWPANEAAKRYQANLAELKVAPPQPVQDPSQAVPAAPLPPSTPPSKTISPSKTTPASKTARP